MGLKKPFPKTIPFKKLLGPSFIILALGLGSGEVILWPFLVATYGLGIAWGAFLGITFQYFMNMEIERYALVKGESVFVGLNKKFRAAVPWFIISTFIGFGIPGIIAASAKVTSHLLGLSDHKWMAIVFLCFIGLILSLGKTVYGMMEKLTKTVLLIGTPFIFILTVILASKSGWIALLKGFIGIGESLATQPSGYLFFPIGISFAAFLAAFAYAGAGGNLNLTQSIYVKEKGYGMGKYSQRMVGLFRRKSSQSLKLEGEECDFSSKSVNRFKKWWKLVSTEHLIVFWLMGLVTMALLMTQDEARTIATETGYEFRPNGIVYEFRKIDKSQANVDKKTTIKFIPYASGGVSSIDVTTSSGTSGYPLTQDGFEMLHVPQTMNFEEEFKRLLKNPDEYDKEL